MCGESSQIETKNVRDDVYCDMIDVMCRLQWFRFINKTKQYQCPSITLLRVRLFILQLQWFRHRTWNNSKQDSLDTITRPNSTRQYPPSSTIFSPYSHHNPRRFLFFFFFLLFFILIVHWLICCRPKQKMRRSEFFLPISFEFGERRSFWHILAIGILIAKKDSVLHFLAPQGPPGGL